MNKFVIGIGSQRAGSTLLHRVLEQCTPIYMHPIKELHYFDTLFNVRNPSVLHKFAVSHLNKDIDRIIKAKELGFLNKRFKNSLRTNFLLSTRKVQHIEYLDLFRPCVQGSKLLGEITPEYMILPPEGIQKMRETLGEDAKIILLARNPVKRFISAFKLLMYGLPNADNLLFEEEILKLLNTENSEWLKVQDALNDYETAFTRYQQEFKYVLMLSYDKLFSDVEATAEKLSDFLEINLSVQNYKKITGTKVNSLEETKELQESTVLLLKKRYAANQTYLDEIFGQNVCLA